MVLTTHVFLEAYNVVKHLRLLVSAFFVDGVGGDCLIEAYFGMLG